MRPRRVFRSQWAWTRFPCCSARCWHGEDEAPTGGNGSLTIRWHSGLPQTQDGATMSFMDEAIPALSDTYVPPVVHGTADLTTFAYQGNGYEALLDRIGSDVEAVASLYDRSIAPQVAFRRAEGLGLQDEALEANQIYRINHAPEGALRMLALVSPGDLMTNTPLDFLTNHLNVRLDLLYLLPDRPLPAVIPDHDVAFFAVGEADPPELERLRRLFARWPRPTLNNPEVLPALERDTLSGLLADVPGGCSPIAVAV